MSVVGDFAGLQKLISSLNSLGKDTSDLNRNLAEEAIDLVKEGFANQSDPYGGSWKSTKRGGRILQDTGRLKASFKVSSVSRTGFQINASTDYASFHQFGTGRMAARPMVPNGALPSAWKSAFVTVANEYFSKKFR